MSTDNFDKSDFSKPSAGSDRTVIRPAPGGRRGAQQSSTEPYGAAIPQPKRSTDVHHQTQVSSQYLEDAGDAYFRTQSGLNPVVSAAAALIAVFVKIGQSLSHSDIDGLHHQLLGEIRKFEHELKQFHIPPEIIVSARYIVCTALDEAVLNTPWGSESAWPQKSLLSIFHNETFGGEKFFLILDRMLEQPAKNITILELMYIFTSLGFEGKYRVINHGKESLEQLRENLFITISRQRGDYERSLSPSWKGLANARKSLRSYIPMWVAASILGAVLLVGYSGIRIWLFDSSVPVVEKLDEISNIRTIPRNVSQ